MSYPFGKWVRIERLPDEPVIAFVYLDPRAGPSAKGGLASERELATMPSRTVRLSAHTRLAELDDAELAARKLPAQPAWLAAFGPQPDPAAPWYRDPLLAGKFHPQHPDDIRAIVHDGDPRRTRRAPELCWVRILRVDAVASAAGRNVYLGELLNAPHALTSVARGTRVKLMGVPGLPHPLQVTDAYLRERAAWTIAPCDRCGCTECFDPPSEVARFRSPDAPASAPAGSITATCAHCGGAQVLARTG